MSARAKTLVQIFRTPAVVLAVSLTGLVVALLIDGPADIAAGTAAAVPIAVIIRALARPYRAIGKGGPPSD